MKAQPPRTLRKYIIISVIVAIGLMMADYLINNSNSQLFWNEKQKIFYKFQQIRNTKEKDKEVFDDAVFIDVSKAITLSEKQSLNGIQSEVITDRKVLLDFLRKIENHGFDFLFIDIRFEEGDTTKFDADLVEQLLKMSKKSNVAIARSYDLENGRPVPQIDDRLDDMAFYVNYRKVNYDQRFCKYDFIQQGNNSIALEMYHRSERKTIVKKGCFYFDGCQLSNNSTALAFHQKSGLNVPARYPIKKLLEENSVYFKDLTEQIRGKHIIICDLGNRDMVGTYMGEQPGAVVNWIAYKTLMKGGHKIGLGLFLFFLIGYTFITYCILRKKTFTTLILCICDRLQSIIVFSRIRSIINIPIVQFLCSFIGYSLFLWLISFMLYWGWDYLFSPVLPPLVFALLSNGVYFKK